MALELRFNVKHNNAPDMLWYNWERVHWLYFKRQHADVTKMPFMKQPENEIKKWKPVLFGKLCSTAFNGQPSSI